MGEMGVTEGTVLGFLAKFNLHPNYLFFFYWTEKSHVQECFEPWGKGGKGEQGEFSFRKKETCMCVKCSKMGFDFFLL